VRAKRYYTLTEKGKAKLLEARELEHKMWRGIPDAI